MAVLIRHRAPMTAAQYDEMSPPLLEEVKKAPGLVLHVAFEDSQGFCVAEVGETKEQHDTFFDAKVVPDVPFEIKQEVINLHKRLHAINRAPRTAPGVLHLPAAERRLGVSTPFSAAGAERSACPSRRMGAGRRRAG